MTRNQAIPIDTQLVDKIVHGIKKAAQPSRIVLFGSAARGTMTADSDLDLLVIVPDGTHRRKTAQAIYMSLMDIGVPKDVIVATESDVRQFGDNPSLVICPALMQGVEIYHAAG